MIHLTDIYGKTWSFRERDIDEFYFDNPNPARIVTVIVGKARIRSHIWVLAVVLPHVFDDIPLKI